ncbi:hypothetical protein ACIOHC_11005 [Streptomyces sp. NPDC088252]|uniref:hypothetical protein n=1 Tax=unclassified Streptomyces TaxID=2593676 RepID=UPI0037F3D117
MAVEPIPCAAPEPEPPTPPCCSPGIASTGLCLADGTPISVLAVSACGDCGADAAAPEVSGWLNLLTGVFTEGAPPPGTEACLGQPQQFEVGQWCDLDADGEVIAPVLVEYEYGDTGQLTGVRTLTPGGDPYTVVGTLGLCPGAVDDIEYLVLCDTLPDGTTVEFLRGLTPNGDGTSTAYDVTLDGTTAYTPVGKVGRCVKTCRDCTTQVLCDTDVMPPATIAGTAASGTLSNGVAWTATGPSAFPPNQQGDGAAWWGLALFPNPSLPVTKFAFDQPITAEFSVLMVHSTGTGAKENTAQLPAGAQPLSLPPGYTYDRATSILSVDATLTDCAPLTAPARANSARFRVTGVSSFALQYLGTKNVLTACARIGNWLFGAVDVSLGGQFLRTVCRDCSGTTTTVTDTLLDGLTPYTPAGTVGVCQPPEAEPCASTVSTLRLCDLNPDVEPTEDGKRCAVPFLRHLVHDCAGALIESRDTEMDGTTPYTPVKVVDCGSGGVPALSELLWPQTGIAEDPAGVARQDFIYTVTNPETSEVARVKLHASSAAPGGCGTYDPANPVFNNPTTYTLTLDEAAQEMSTFRLDLLDFDTFEGVTGLNPIPSRVEGDVTWNGSTIRSNQNNITAYVYFDNPPAQISYRYGNTGGGRACTSVRFQGMTLVPDGCCGCGSSGNTEPCRDTSSTLLCDTAATDLITVFDPANRPSSDGWEVVSFTGANPGAGPETAMPYPAPYGTPMGYPSLGARADQNAGSSGAQWPGYDAAPVHWVLRKTFQAPENGVAVAQSVGFRGDGGARVRINGVDAGMYGQWNQPATSGTAQIPVTAGPNTVEIEVRDTNGINNVVGRLDIALPHTTQFMRRQTVDCETGDVIATHDTTLDGDPYTVTGEVGQCETLSECCEQAPPEQRVDVETELLCIRDEASGNVLGQVVVERVYDNQTGDRLEQRLTDPTTGDPVELPTGAVLARCPSPDRITRQICVVRSGTTEFLTNAGNATSGQDVAWQWAPNLSGTWYPMYEVAPNALWTVTDPAPNPAHWVSPHANKGVCSPNPAAAPHVSATWYTRASWNLPTDVDPETIRIAATVLNADNDVVQWRLNDGEWQPVAGGQFGPPAWSFPPTAVPGGRAGQNEVIVQILETQPPSSVPCPNNNQAGMILHVAATYDHEPRVWTQVVEDGRVYYLDETGTRQEKIPDGDRIVACGGGGGGECCPQPECRNASTLLLCDVPADGEPDPTVTDTAPGPYYPYPTGLAMAGAQTLWDGSALTIPPGTGPQPGTTGTVRTLAAKVQAPRPACDTGTAHVTVSVDAAQLGPDTGCAITGAVRLFNGTKPVATVLPPNDAKVGWSGTLTVEADVPAADLAAGNLVFFVALDTYDDSPQACPGSPRKSSWKLSGLTAAVVYEQTDCATQILRTVTVDCETGAVLTVTDTTLGGDPYTVTGEVGECTTGGGDCCPAEECRDTSTVLLCDSTGGPPALDPAAVSVRAAAPPVAAMTAKYPNHRWQDADATAVQAVVDGKAASWGNTAGLDNWTRPDWFVWGGFGFSLAGSPQCGTWDDAGDVVLTMRVKVINKGPHPGVDADGVFAVFNGTTWIGAKSVQNSLPVGASSTLTLDPVTVAVADLPNVVAVLALELKQGNSEKTWTVQEFTYSLAPVPDSGTAVPGCEQTQFLRTLVTDCTGEIVSTSDTTLDGKPYEVGGEVGQCTPASGGGTTQPEPCQATSVLESCRCDDTDGDGVADTDYVELLAVDCEGALTSIGTYTPDLSAPYTPVAPMPCETEGAPTATGVQARRVELAAGEAWNAAAWPTLQSVTAVARGTGTITTADGTSSLVAGESVTWSVARDDDALLTGPLTITADTGTVAVSFTTGATL